MLVPVQLPELGVGVVYFPGLEPLMEEARGLLDVVEIEPQVFWFKTRSGNAPYRLSEDLPKRLATYGRPVLVHGVGCPVAGTVPPDPAALAMFAQTVRQLSAPWCSEHLSFNRIRTRDGECCTGFLLPPSQTPESVAVAVDNIRRIKSSLGVPFLFETGVSYLQPRPGEMADGDFFCAVAEQADCGILLDLHNLWANQRNGRQAVLEVIAQLPLERVWEVHIAGGQSLDSYWLDAHSGVAPAELMDLAAQIVPRLPNLKAVIFEIVPDYIPAYNIRTAELVDQIWQMRRLWHQRPSRGRNGSRLAIMPSSLPETQAPTPGEWEEALGSLVIGAPTDTPLSQDLSSDPGVAVLRRLVGSVRAGMTVDTLRLTCRLLMLKLGDQGFQDLLQAFWKSAPPEQFASEEALNFAAFLKLNPPGVEHAGEVLEYELANHQACIEGTAGTVPFTCEPTALLTALGQGRLPPAAEPGQFEVLVEPPSQISNA